MAAESRLLKGSSFQAAPYLPQYDSWYLADNPTYRLIYEGSLFLHVLRTGNVISNVLKMREKGVVCLVMSLVCAYSAIAGEASKLFKEGKKAEEKGEIARAYLLYSQAAALEPKNKNYWLKSQAVRTRASIQAKVTVPSSAANIAPDADDDDDTPEITLQDLAQAKQPLPPVELRADGGRKDFNLKGPPRVLFETIAKAFGLDCVFDGEYPESGTTISFQMNGADYRESLRALQAATASFIVPVTSKVFLVAKDTQQKRNDVEPSVTVIVPIPQVLSAQEAQELARSIQQVMDIRGLAIDATRRLVMLRGPISKIRPAQQLFDDLLSFRSEVSVELQFIEVTRTELTTIGPQLQTSFPFVPLTTILKNVPIAPKNVSYLLTFGGGASLFGIGMAGAQLTGQFSKGNARTLLDTSVRSLDNMPATFHVGDKYPVLTSGYYGPTDTSGGTAYRPPPSFNFEDLGLSVKVTPRIHGMDEVSLDIEAEFKVLGSQSFNGVPVISTKKLTSKVRLKTGESAVIAGMMSTSEARSISGLAGLAQIPGLGALMRQNQHSKDGSEVILVLKPHLLSLPADEIVTKPVWVGTETRPLAPL